MADNECCFVGQITRGFCACCAGPNMELMESAFFRKFFVFCLFWIETVHCYVNGRNTVRIVVKLCSNERLFSQLNY